MEYSELNSYLSSLEISENNTEKKNTETNKSTIESNSKKTINKSNETMLSRDLELFSKINKVNNISEVNPHSLRKNNSDTINTKINDRFKNKLNLGNNMAYVNQQTFEEQFYSSREEPQYRTNKSEQDGSDLNNRLNQRELQPCSRPYGTLGKQPFLEELPAFTRVISKEKKEL